MPEMEKTVTLYSDYSGRPESAVVAVVRVGKRGKLHAQVQWFPTDIGSSVGEMYGVLMALQHAQKRGWRRVVVHCDCTNTVRWVASLEPKATGSAAHLLALVKQAMSTFEQADVLLVDGKLNLAHPLATSGMTACRLMTTSKVIHKGLLAHLNATGALASLPPQNSTGDAELSPDGLEPENGEGKVTEEPEEQRP